MADLVQVIEDAIWDGLLLDEAEEGHSFIDSNMGIVDGRFDMKVVAEHVAAVIREAHTIRTLEQLDALEYLALVQESDTGAVYRKLHNGWDCLDEDGNAGLLLPTAVRLPATVLSQSEGES